MLLSFNNLVIIILIQLWRETLLWSSTICKSQLLFQFTQTWCRVYQSGSQAVSQPLSRYKNMYVSYYKSIQFLYYRTDRNIYLLVMLCTFKCFIRTCSNYFPLSFSSYYFNYKTLQRDSTYSMYIFNYNH